MATQPKSTFAAAFIRGLDMDDNTNALVALALIGRGLAAEARKARPSQAFPQQHTAYIIAALEAGAILAEQAIQTDAQSGA